MKSKNANHYLKLLSHPLSYAAIISLAILSGLSNVTILHQLGAIISEFFIQVFKCVSLPIIALSIIVTLFNYNADKYLKRVWQRTIRYTLLTTLVAAFISFLLYLLIHPSSVSEVNSTYSHSGTSSYLSHIANIIPGNIFAPFIEHQVISVLILSLVLGISIKQIPDEEARNVVMKFFYGIHGMFLVITRWIVAIIPIGLYGFVTTTLVQLRGGMSFKGIGQYLLIIVLANLIQGFIVLPLWLKSKGINPLKTFKGMVPALSLAFFSKSSVGSLPVTMSTIEKNCDVKPKISRFVLPLCTSINMNGCAAFIFATVIFVMQNQGIHVSIPMMLMWVFISTVAAIGNAGVPMGCFFLSASLLVGMNVPIHYMGIILPFYGLIDMLETALNVWSDSCVTKVVNDGIDEVEVSRDYTGAAEPIEALAE